MQAVAAEIGYSETAYISPRSGKRRRIRYFTPETEVAFCGHATIASAVALGEREGSGDYEFECRAGTIPVQVREQDGRICASLRSVRPRQEAIGDDARRLEPVAQVRSGRKLPLRALFKRSPGTARPTNASPSKNHRACKY